MFKRHGRWTLAALAAGLFATPAIAQDSDWDWFDNDTAEYDSSDVELSGDYGREVEMDNYARERYRDGDAERYRVNRDRRTRLSDDYGREVEMDDYARERYRDGDAERYRVVDRDAQRRLRADYGREVEMDDYADDTYRGRPIEAYSRPSGTRDQERNVNRYEYGYERDRREMRNRDGSDQDYRNTIRSSSRDGDMRRRMDDDRRRFDEDRRRLGEERRRFDEERRQFDRERQSWERRRQQTTGSATDEKRADIKAQQDKEATQQSKVEKQKAEQQMKAEQEKARKVEEKARQKDGQKSDQSDAEKAEPKSRKQSSLDPQSSSEASQIYAFDAGTPKSRGETQQITGTISGINSVTLNDIKSNRLMLKTEDGRDLTVLLSPARTAKDLPIKKGQQITVQGHTRTIGGDDLLIASRIEAGDQQTITIQRDRNEQSLRGKITSIGVSPNPSEGTQNRVLVLKSDDGRDVIVDLGPDVRLQGVSLENGQQIKVRGQMASVDDRPLLIADTLDITRN